VKPRPPVVGTWRVGRVHSITPIRPRHELEAGDRHLPRALSLPLSAWRPSVAPLFLDNIHDPRAPAATAIHAFAVAKKTLLDIDKEAGAKKWRLLDHAVMALQPVFPHTVLAYTADHCGVFTSYPISPDEALINVSILVDPAVRATKPESYWDTNRGPSSWPRWPRIFAVGTTIQSNFRSGANKVPDLRQVSRKALGWYHAEKSTKAIA